MDGEISHRVARKERSRNGACERVPVGTRIPVAKCRAMVASEVPSRDVAKLDLWPDGLLGYP